MAAHLHYAPIPDAVYDYAELQVCADYIDPDGSLTCESMGNASPEAVRLAMAAVADGDAKRWFYTVYWHLAEGGVEAVADFAPDCKADAERLLSALMCAVATQRGRPFEAVQYAKQALT